MELAPAHLLLDSNVPFRRYGYQIFRGDLDEFFEVKEMFRAIMEERINDYSKTEIMNFELEKYHEHLQAYQLEHHQFIAKTKRILPESLLDLSLMRRIKQQAETLFGVKLDFYRNSLEFRVVRPKEPDNNPLHRDHWFKYFKPLINVYLPLSGSYNDSVIQLAPASHLWGDDEVKPSFEAGTSKTIKNGVPYSVPTISESVKEISLHRPDVLPGDFMLFSPLAVHGAGSNSSPETRFSFEFRLERSD